VIFQFDIRKSTGPIPNFQPCHIAKA